MTSPIDIAKRVLKIEADAIFNLIERLDADYVRAIELILKQKGRLLVLGVGKSGHIGRKIAATLSSTGQPSFYIHPTEAIHGDLGMMVPGDICLMISHSGNTDELLATIPSIKRFGLPIIAVTANTDSKLARYADITLNTHVTEEACPFNLAPTSSTTAALAYGDAIAITLLTMRGFKEEHFAMCHPGGVLGKRLLTKVGDIMIKEGLPTVHRQATFRTALSAMTHGRQGIVIVVDDNEKSVGVLTDGDIRRTMEKYDRISDILLDDIYTRQPKTIKEDALATEALKKMQNNKITSLIVTNGGEEIVGLIHIHHLLEQGFY
ncbi:MAG: KpsF/GutQ family sugar-phosphate isomerase [Desulfobacterales bacterium]